MLPAVVRWAILPVHEMLLGRSTFSIWRQLELHPILTPDQVRQVQYQGLRRILDHAVAHVPYWKERLAGKLPSSDSGDPAALLASVPVLTRAEIRRNREAMRWADAPGKVLRHTSGGTTDDNLIFYWGRARQSWDRATRWRGLARHGIYPGDRVLHIWPGYSRSQTWPRLKQSFRELRDWLVNDIVIDMRPGSPERLDDVLARTEVYGPAAIIAYPSWLTALARHLRTTGRSVRWPGLRLVLCTGEVLFDFQRRLLEETFGVRVFQEYGSQDSGLIAHEDPEGQLRLNGEQMFVEILRDGQPVPPGELGEVVVTHFYNEVMPFIRYATGDVVRQVTPSDPKAAGLPPFPLPEGRTSDLLLTDEGSLCPMRPFVEALVERVGLEDFSLYQPEPGQVQILEVEQVNGKEDRHHEAEEILRGFLGRRVAIEWKVGKHFAALRSGKKRYVCSPAAMRQIAHDQESGISLARAWPQLLLDT